MHVITSFPRSAWGMPLETLPSRTVIRQRLDGRHQPRDTRRRASKRAFPRRAWEREGELFANLRVAEVGLCPQVQKPPRLYRESQPLHALDVHGQWPRGIF